LFLGEFSMKVGIIGARGFLGKSISKRFTENDMPFLIFTHQPISQHLKSDHMFDVLTPYLDEINEISHIIYCAWKPDRRRKIQKQNYLAARYVSRWCLDRNISCLFISSLSAIPEKPKSNYGFWKKKAETEFLLRNQSIVRPGTIIPVGSSTGSSLDELFALRFFAKNVISILKPALIPVISESVVVDYVMNWLNGSTHVNIDLVTEVSSIQSLLNIKAGKIPFRILKVILFLIPINIKDRIKVIIDLQEKVCLKESKNI